VISPTLEADPDTGPASQGTPAGPPVSAPEGSGVRHLRAERRAFADIPRETWDRLAARNPWATPFSAWAFHRAWWDGYGEGAHEQTMVVVDADAGASAGTRDGPAGAVADPVAIVPLMHRHVVEDADATTHTTIRHGGGTELTPVEPTAKAIYFGASYHADYATILAAPDDLPAVADALVDSLCPGGHPDPDHPAEWDVIDLRRLRRADPASDALAAAFGAREMAEGWTLNLEQEDVCPVATLPTGGNIDDYLATLGKKERHEIRRKVRRADTHGGIRFVESTDPLGPATLDGTPGGAPAPDANGRTDLEIFIDLHQARWGAEGLFPDTPGGAQSRVFLKRLFEEFRRVTDASAAAASRPASPASSAPAPDASQPAASDSGCPIRLNFLWVGDRRVAASIHFETPDSILYYNAGIDPESFAFSPGVVLVECLVRRALETGRTRLDFMRGNEPYKYEWGARDEPIQRLLVRRGTS
jgi:CelD/BcsL family acetyltransferase involved in cellulose biosynthesis